MALRDFPSKIKFCHCRATDADPLVKNDLAITPKRMYDLTLKGTPISEQTAAYSGDFIDGYRGKIDFEPPHVYTRHADMISCWNTQIDSKLALRGKIDESVAAGLAVEKGD